MAIPEQVGRAKRQLLAALVVQLRALVQVVESNREKIERFLASMPAAKLVESLPVGKSGTTVRMLWA